MVYKYSEMRKILPRLLEYYEPMIAAQHMGTIGEDVPVPSGVVFEIREIMEAEVG